MSGVVLHQFPPCGAMRSLSPYCWKVLLALDHKGVEYRLNNTLLAKRHNPRGKLPFLDWDGEGRTMVSST